MFAAFTDYSGTVKFEPARCFSCIGVGTLHIGGATCYCVCAGRAHHPASAYYKKWTIKY